MSIEYKTYKINDFIRKTPKGEHDYDKSIKLVRELAGLAGFHSDRNLLVDLRQTEQLRDFGDVLTVAIEFAKYKDVFRNKVAFVIPNTPDRIKRAKFFIAALGEVKFQMEYYTEFEKAIEWFSTTTKYPKENT